MMNKHAGKAKAMMAKCGYASGGSIGSAVPGLKRGGATKKHHAKTNVNVIVAPGGGPRPPMPMMPPRPPIGAGPPGAGGPPPGGMAPPPGLPPGGPPPGLAGGLPPGVRPPGMKRGGGVSSYPIDGGGAGAKGRLEKIKAYGG